MNTVNINTDKPIKNEDLSDKSSTKAETSQIDLILYRLNEITIQLQEIKHDINVLKRNQNISVQPTISPFSIPPPPSCIYPPPPSRFNPFPNQFPNYLHNHRPYYQQSQGL